MRKSNIVFFYLLVCFSEMYGSMRVQLFHQNFQILFFNQLRNAQQCGGSLKFWYGSESADPFSHKWIRIRIRLQIRILLFSSVTFKTSIKKSFKSFFAYYFLKKHLHHFSKIKGQTAVTKQQESMFFLLFLLDDRRIWIRISD